MSGTGKSTVLGELAARGHRVVDLDDPGWSREVPTGDGGVEQVWELDRVARLLDGHGAHGAHAAHDDGLLVVAGCAADQARFYDRFEAVVLLSAPAEVMLERIAARRTNPFGRLPQERARILRDLAEVEPLLRATCTCEIDTRRPVAEVADLVEALATGAG
ncbi:MAG: AAA family ATPase [Frankiales bacterium]|nr:AAA family ATPase [Frankiales bacterium]